MMKAIEIWELIAVNALSSAESFSRHSRPQSARPTGTQGSLANEPDLLVTRLSQGVF